MEGAKSVKIEALSSAEFDRLDFGHVLDTKEKKREAYLEYVFEVEGETISGEPSCSLSRNTSALLILSLKPYSLRKQNNSLLL